ncbi:MAG: 4Fe-4S dicluster domain-containing protein [Chloroflexota bacterium]
MGEGGWSKESGRRRVFLFDQDGCIGCRACQMACKDLHDLPVGVNWRWVETREFGTFPRVTVLHLSLSCNHCGKPSCLVACPTGAISRREEDGLVLIDEALCGGCLECIDACPYGAIQYDERTGRVGKCDLCADLTAQGEEPACVAACPMRVLHYVYPDDLSEYVPQGPGLPDPALTDPALRIIPHRNVVGRDGACGNSS